MMPADTAPAWDGRPDKPKRPIYHWLTTDEFAAEPIPVRWQPGLNSWRIGPAQDDNATPEQIVAAGYDYLGPCLMPHEVQHHTRAATAAAWLAAREACFREAHARADFYVTQGAASKVAAAMRVHDAIRALPPPADAAAALAEVVRKAKEEEREANAKIAQAIRVPFKDIDPDKYAIGVEIAAAIRARGGEA